MYRNHSFRYLSVMTKRVLAKSNQLLFSYPDDTRMSKIFLLYDTANLRCSWCRCCMIWLEHTDLNITDSADHVSESSVVHSKVNLNGQVSNSGAVITWRAHVTLSFSAVLHAACMFSRICGKPNSWCPRWLEGPSSWFDICAWEWLSVAEHYLTAI